MKQNSNLTVQFIGASRAVDVQSHAFGNLYISEIENRALKTHTHIYNIIVFDIVVYIPHLFLRTVELL